MSITDRYDWGTVLVGVVASVLVGATLTLASPAPEELLGAVLAAGAVAVVYLMWRLVRAVERIATAREIALQNADGDGDR